MNRLNLLFEQKAKNLLSVYFTAGFPGISDTVEIMKALEQGGADIIEIGIPFSDPVADGPTIQDSNKLALQNGMTMELLFEQLKTFREEMSIPVVLMGYVNPVYQYGMEKFAKKCEEVGIDGLILPDLPLYEYEDQFREVFQKHNLSSVFLVTPQTTEDRIRKIDSLSESFIYLVSSASITGAKGNLSNTQLEYFRRINALGLSTQHLIGFGISNRESFEQVCQYSSGAIIGSAFINMLADSKDLSKDIISFIKDIKNK